MAVVDRNVVLEAETDHSPTEALEYSSSSEGYDGVKPLRLEVRHMKSASSGDLSAHEHDMPDDAIAGVHSAPTSPAYLTSPDNHQEDLYPGEEEILVNRGEILSYKESHRDSQAKISENRIPGQWITDKSLSSHKSSGYSSMSTTQPALSKRISSSTPDMSRTHSDTVAGDGVDRPAAELAGTKMAAGVAQVRVKEPFRPKFGTLEYCQPYPIGRGTNCEVCGYIQGPESPRIWRMPTTVDPNSIDVSLDESESSEDSAMESCSIVSDSSDEHVVIVRRGSPPYHSTKARYDHPRIKEGRRRHKLFRACMCMMKICACCD